MTLQEVKQIRDNLMNAILQLNLIMLDHSIGDASYSHDTHRAQLMTELKYWDKIYISKLWGGRRIRQDMKSV